MRGTHARSAQSRRAPLKQILISPQGGLVSKAVNRTPCASSAVAHSGVAGSDRRFTVVRVFNEFQILGFQI